MIVRFLSRYSIVLLVSLLIARDAGATWTKTHPVPGTARIYASWFFDPMNGFIGYNIQSVTPVLRTFDGGVNWRAVTFQPALTVGMTHKVTDIWFRDSLTGWMTMDWQKDLTDGVLWHTSDGGATWVQIKTVTSMMTPSCVWQTAAMTTVTESNGLGLWRSTDSGATWVTSIGTQMNGLGFIGNLIGVCTADKNNWFLYTADGGVYWRTPPAGSNFKHEAWSVYPWRNAGLFVAVPEDSAQGGGSFVYHTKPYYPGLWAKGKTKLPFRTNGHIAGVDNVIYIQNSGSMPGPDSGLYRSMDTGNTWTPVGGPNEDFDVRFSVTGCGDVVYAFDNYGNIYKTIDGGDGFPIPRCVFIDKDTLRPVLSAVCDSASSRYWLHNTNYGPIFIQDIRIIDTVRKPWKSTAVYIDSFPAPYASINPGDSVSFDLGWRPIRMMDSTGSDSATLRVIYNTTYLNRFDTIYRAIKLSAFSAASQFALSTLSVKADSVSPCVVFDTTLSLTNVGCDTLRLTKMQLSFLSPFSMLDSAGQPIKLPARIPPDSTFKFRMRDSAVTLKSVADSVRLTMHYQGHDTVATVKVEFRGVYSSPLTASLPPMQFDSLATCVTMDSTVFISNSGCETLSITQVDLTGTDWTLLDTNGNAISYPIAVPPGTHAAFMLRFGPKVVGAKYGSLKLHIQYLDSATTHTMSLAGTGVDVGIFSYLKAFDFGGVSVCAYSDTTVTFRNTSCSTITLQRFAASGEFTLLDSALIPSSVKPGGALSLHVRFKPGAKTGQNGQAIIWYLMDGKSFPDTLVFSGFGTSGISTFETKPALTAQSFASRTECDHTDSISFSIHNSGCDTTRVTGLTLDGNLGAVFQVSADKSLPALIFKDSLVVKLAIATLVQGNYTGNLHLQFTLADGSMHDTLVPVTLSVSRGPRYMAMSTTPIAFDTITACVSRDTTIVYTDTGCAAFTVSERSISGAGFTLTKQGSDPFVIKPGQSDTLHIHYDGSVSGTIQATITIKSDADLIPDRQITVSAFALPGDTVHFVLKVSKMPLKAGETFTVGLYPDRTVKLAGITAISGVLAYYDDAFNILSGPNAMPSTTISTWNAPRIGRSLRGTFKVSNAAGLSLDTNVPLISLQLEALVADSVGGDIFVDSLHLTGASANAADCMVSNLFASVQTSMAPLCNDSILIGALRGQGLLLITPPKPNPVTAENDYSTGLTLHAGADGTARIEVWDALGRLVSREDLALRRGPNDHQLKFGNAPSGRYSYIIRFFSASGEGQARGSVMLMR